MNRVSGWTITVALLAGGLVIAHAQQRKKQVPKPRVVITADPELDDNNTLIRAILYSSDLKIEGLIYVSSQFHWAGDGESTTQYISGREYTRMGLCPCTSWRFRSDEHFIDDIVDAYAKAYSNLKVHDPDYPNPAELKSKIKWGNVQFDGDFSKDTDGSNLIKSLLLDDRPGPLYVTAQGGESTIARALKSIYEQYGNTSQWNVLSEKVSRKLVIIPSGDQDGTGAGYIRPNWPDVKEWQFGTGGPNFGYVAQLVVIAPEDHVYLSPEWTQENILSRGPLGTLYRVWGDGKQMVKGDRTDYFGLSGYTAEQLKQMGYMVWMPPQEKGSFLGEGDTPTFINLINIGLRTYENPSWGGWGGRTRHPNEPQIDFFSGGNPMPKLPLDSPGIARGLAPAGSKANAPSGEKKSAAPATIDFASMMPKVSPQMKAIAAAFFAAAQNDFAARLKWAVTPKFSDANHPPKVSIRSSLDISARPGSTVNLEGEVSDPDQNVVSVKWWQHNDAGTYPGDITFSSPTTLRTTFRVPDDAKPGQAINIVLEATDDGTPHLTRYARIVVTIQ